MVSFEDGAISFNCSEELNLECLGKINTQFNDFYK